MSEKKPSYNALLRKIERLEAENQALRIRVSDTTKTYASDLSAWVELNARIEQAIQLLKGETV